MASLAKGSLASAYKAGNNIRTAARRG